jgi:hypothetical protein
MKVETIEEKRRCAKVAGDTFVLLFRAICEARDDYPKGPEAFNDTSLLEEALGEGLPEDEEAQVLWNRLKKLWEKAERLIGDSAESEVWKEKVLDTLSDRYEEDGLDEENTEEIQTIRALWILPFDVALGLRKRLDSKLSGSEVYDRDWMEERVAEIVSNQTKTLEELQNNKSDAELARRTLLRIVESLSEMVRKLSRREAEEWMESLFEILNDEDWERDAKKKSEDWVLLPSLALMAREKIDQETPPEDQVDADVFHEQICDLLFDE